ncbi:MAG: WD40 repeat domain-containing protein [Candidatus Methylacidiphilales bacterium]
MNRACAVAWSLDGGKLAVVYQSGDIHILTSEPGSEVLSVERVIREANPANSGFSPGCISWSPDGKSLAYNCQGRSRLLDIDTSSSVLLESTDKWTNSCEWSSDSRRVAMQYNHKVNIWEREHPHGDPEVLQFYPTLGGDGPNYRMYWSPDDRYLACLGMSFFTCIFDMRRESKEERAREIQFKALEPWCMAWSPDSQKLAMIDNMQKERIRETPATPSPRTSGKFYSTATPRPAPPAVVCGSIWSLKENASLLRLSGEGIPAAASKGKTMRWSRDGRQIAGAFLLEFNNKEKEYENRIYLTWWDAATGKILASREISHAMQPFSSPWLRMKTENESFILPYNDCAWSPEGDRFVLISNFGFRRGTGSARRGASYNRCSLIRVYLKPQL